MSFRCKIGFFGLSEKNPYGCVSCFCYGHSKDCVSSTGYYSTAHVSDFETGLYYHVEFHAKLQQL